MTRKLTTLVLISMSLYAKSQTLEEIGKSIFEAFKNNFSVPKQYLFWKDSNFIEYNKKISITEKQLADSFRHSQIKILDDDWNKLLTAKKDCKISINKNEIIKDTSLSEPRFLLKFNNENAAVIFHIISINGNTYLIAIDSKITYPNEKGQYNCSCSYNNGKPLYTCVELEEIK